MRTSRQVWAGGRPYSLTQEKSQEQNSDNLPSQVGFYRTRSILATLVTYSLTDCCLVDLIDVTLDLEAEVWSTSQTFVQTLSTRFGHDFEVEVQARFETGVWPAFFSADVL